MHTFFLLEDITVLYLFSLNHWSTCNSSFCRTPVLTDYCSL